MLRKKIAALLAAMMTISSLGTAAFGAIEDGLSYDKLLGNALLNGTFENGVNVGADEWVPKTGISRVVNVTHLDSAGAAFVNLTNAAPVYCSFRMDSYKYYSAEAYVRLYDETKTDNAKLVLAVKNGDTFEPISSTAVKTEVNGTEWTKLEGEFINLSTEENAVICCYIELENEKKFYLDDVVVKKTDYILPTTVDSVELVEDNDGNKYLMGTLTADATGKADNKGQSHPFQANTQHIISARLMLDNDSITTTAEAYTACAKMGNTYNFKGTKVGLTAGVHTNVTYNISNTTNNPGSWRIGAFIEGATENDVIYFGGFSVATAAGAPAAAAVIDNPVITSAAAGLDAQVTVPNPVNAVALRYFYLMGDSADATSWTPVLTGHTLSGSLDVPGIPVKLGDVGRFLKVKVVPMNEDLVFGEAKESAPVEIAAPFNTGVIGAPTVDDETGVVTSTFDVTNSSGQTAPVTAVVAYYNQKGEMIAIGAETITVPDGETETFEIEVEDAASYTTRSVYLLNGGADDEGVLALFPLADAK